MIKAEIISQQLCELRAQGALPRSRCSLAFMKMIAPLLHAGVLAEERSGAGRRIVVRNPEALHEFYSQSFPDHPTPLLAPSRAAGIARFRDSKSLRNDCPEIICARGAAPDLLRFRQQPVPLAQATQLHQLFAFALHKPADYSLHGPCALIENPALFFAFEKLRLPASIAIYARGRCSRRLLHWFAAQTDHHFSVCHLPDYDPTGLHEFTRLRDSLGPRAQLYIPPNLPELFKRFSNRRLLSHGSTQQLLRELRANTLPEIRAVLDLIDSHNAGLEQEALLL